MSIADELKKLAELRSQGVLSDAEFEAQKAALLSGVEHPASATTSDAQRDWRDVPLADKWWFQLIVTALANPIGLLLMLFRKSFQKTRTGEVKRVGRVSKLAFGSLGALVWVLGLASLSSGPMTPGGSTSPPVAAIDACDSAEARGAVTNAIEQNASSNLDTFKLLDMRDIVEVQVLDGGKVRRCNATLVLNSGDEAVGFELSPDSTGKMLLVTLRDPYPKPTVTTPASPSAPDQGAIEPEAYFASVGIKPVTGPSGLSVASLIPAYEGVQTEFLSAVEVAPGTVAVLIESGKVPQNEQGCHACSAPVSMIWIGDFATAAHVLGEARDFATLGSWGHAPEARAVALPGGGKGFAFEVGSTAQGVTESGCLIYEVGRDRVTLRQDLSRSPSSEEPKTCS